jgi:hypothetical protein
LHRRAHPVAIADVDVIAHADLIAVIDDRRAGHRQQQTVDELDAVAIVVEQRRKPPPDADVQAHARLLRVHPVHVVALAVRDHLERELVVIAQENGPLTVLRDIRRLPHDLGDRIAVLEGHGHEDARHQREVIGHVALITVAEILAHVFRPLIRLGEEHAALVVRVHRGAHALEHLVRFRQVLVVRPFAYAQIGNRIEAHAVDAHVHPEAHDVDDRFDDARIVVIEVRLVREEAVPVVLFGDRIPRPVGGLRIGEDDARARELLVVVAPDVELASGRARRGAARFLEPRMLIRGVIDHELGDHLQPAPMGLLDEMTKVIERPVIRVHVAVVGDVVAVVLERRGIERQQPDGVDAELLDVVEPLRQPGEIADAVVVRVEERLDMHLIDDGVLVPERIDVALRGSSCTGQRGIRAGTLDVQGQHAFGGTFVVVHIRDRICARLELQSHTIDTKRPSQRLWFRNAPTTTGRTATEFGTRSL